MIIEREHLSVMFRYKGQTGRLLKKYDGRDEFIQIMWNFKSAVFDTENGEYYCEFLGDEYRDFRNTIYIEFGFEIEEWARHEDKRHAQRA
jgi:hypothetical protein